MAVMCSILTCHHNKVNGHCLKGKFYIFPKDIKTRIQWVKISGNTKLTDVSLEEIKKNKYICGCHFKDDDFEINKIGKKKLKLTAVPSIEIKVKPLPDNHMAKLKISNDSVVQIKKNVTQLDKQVSGNKNPVCLKNDVLSVGSSAGSEHILRSNEYNNIQEVDEVFLDDQSVITVENKNAPSVMEGKQDLPSKTGAGPLFCKEINNQSMIIDEENFDDENTVIKNISNPFVMEEKQDLPSETGDGPSCCREINNQSMIIYKENINDENTVIKNISNPFVMEEKQDLSPKTKVTGQGVSSQSSHRRHSFPEINNDKPTVSLFNGDIFLLKILHPPQKAVSFKILNPKILPSNQTWLMLSCE